MMEQGFLDTYRDCFLWQHVIQATRYRALQAANILDLVMTNEKGMIHEVEYNESFGKSDHLVLNWTYNSYSEQSTSVTVKRLYNDGNYDKIREDLEGTDWVNILKDNTVDEQWIIIRTRILDAVNTYVPQKTIITGHTTKCRKPLWMNESVLSRIKRKRSAFEFLQANHRRQRLSCLYKC